MNTCRLSRSFAASMAVVIASLGSANADPLSGAIFTTTFDGAIVNENVHYEAKEDVYLDGGPGPNAPASAAGLPDGEYYFQVTDPSGKDLLSTDHIECRKIRVEEGVIVEVVLGYTLEKNQGKWQMVSCRHAEGVDIDHSELGAITVQLFPYDDTPNPGGVYKAWVTPVGNYIGVEPNGCIGNHGACNVNGEGWMPANVHGFIPAFSKTDNYKVRERGRPPLPPSELTVRKFHDKNLDGIQDEGESDISGWEITITDPLNVTNPEFTPVMVVAAEPGNYAVVEEIRDGTLQTVSILDGLALSQFPNATATVNVNFMSAEEEFHEVVFGNVGLGSIQACKVFDRDEDGMADADEPGVVGWRFQLSSSDALDANGMPFETIVQETGEDGCTTFGGLLPGDYRVHELLPEDNSWKPTGPTFEDFLIESTLSDGVLAGTATGGDFTNSCRLFADFDTKGYWHNKNGLTELTQADIDYVNSLDPYNNPTSYFDDGDEPFDGYFSDGTPVDAAIGDGVWQGVAVAPAGTAKAEISQFLVDRNANGDPREQLAQQLLAFIFNVRHRLGSASDNIELPDGSLASAQSLIAAAISIWQSGSSADRNAMQELLNALNNDDSVPVIPFEPCPVVYDNPL